LDNFAESRRRRPDRDENRANHPKPIRIRIASCDRKHDRRARKWMLKRPQHDRSADDSSADAAPRRRSQSRRTVRVTRRKRSTEAIEQPTRRVATMAGRKRRGRG
jgi:hypothetical protein